MGASAEFDSCSPGRGMRKLPSSFGSTVDDSPDAVDSGPGTVRRIRVAKIGSLARQDMLQAGRRAGRFSMESPDEEQL